MADRHGSPSHQSGERTDLVAAFLEAQRAAVLEIADQGLVSLARLVETQAIDVAPSFQRRDRWDSERQSLLIESLMTNIPVPPVYLAEDLARIGSYAVIDGKQRLTAISVFFADRLTLRGLTRLTDFNGLRYSQLPPQVQNALGMKNLRITTLLRQSNEELKHEVFLRLNTGGEVLNAQEIRNVAYRGPLNDLIYGLAENDFLRKQFKVQPPSSPAYRQMTDAEFVLRFFTLHAHWRAFSGGLREAMDQFMMVNRFLEPGHLDRLAKTFRNAIDIAEAVWDGEAFKRPGRDQALAGLYDAQMIAVASLNEEDRANLVKQQTEVRSATAQLFDSAEFDEAVRRGTNTPSRLRFRTEALIQTLRPFVG
ncbi:DUF262 domain-containing protein [uncultured Cellulomonas sp.]|uniref:DUF262 domain-containing protein n=1 Tax=uncultured Cellulomonas sp. TaxID=189682 RepID=UPI00260866A2|nr:DUF262 domain-containing protein [uncultured Cellulomonas sp.]